MRESIDSLLSSLPLSTTMSFFVRTKIRNVYRPIRVEENEKLTIKTIIERGKYKNKQQHRNENKLIFLCIFVIEKTIL